MFKRIDHVELITNEPDRIVAFYTEVLGFKVKDRNRIERSSAGVPMDLVYLELGGTAVELITYRGVNMGAAPTGLHLGYNLIALEVDDMGEALAFLRRKGIETAWGPRTLERSARAEILDPDGNHIELRQWF